MWSKASEPGQIKAGCVLLLQPWKTLAVGTEPESNQAWTGIGTWPMQQATDGATLYLWKNRIYLSLSSLALFKRSLPADSGVPLPCATALGIKRGGGRGFLDGETDPSFPSFLSGTFSEESLISSLLQTSGFAVTFCAASDSVAAPNFFSADVIGDLTSERVASVKGLPTLSFPATFSLFSPSSFSSVFALFKSVLTPLDLTGMVNVNLGLCEDDARGTEGAWFVEGIVDGFGIVEVDAGVRLK